MPETNSNKRLEIYKAIKFPIEWELYSTAFDGDNIADVTYFRDNIGKRWLFVSKGMGVLDDHSSELYIYQIENLKLLKIRAHKQNPVLIDSRRARSAGPIFEYQNNFIRPSQDNSNGVYGYGLNLNRIITLNLDEYSEKTIITIEPKFRKGLEGIHHLHQLDNKFVFDAAFKVKYWRK